MLYNIRYVCVCGVCNMFIFKFQKTSVDVDLGGQARINLDIVSGKEIKIF